MAGRKAGAPSRSAFIRDQLTANSELSLKNINEAWKSAGQKGAITPTLFYQVKSKGGFSSGRRRKAGRRGLKRSLRASSNTYLEIEIGLEGLVAQAEAMGNKDLAEAIRTARRMASAKLI